MSIMLSNKSRTVNAKATVARGQTSKRPWMTNGETESRSSTPVSHVSGASQDTSTPPTSQRTSSRIAGRRGREGRHHYWADESVAVPAAKKSRRNLDEYADESEVDESERDEHGWSRKSRHRETSGSSEEDPEAEKQPDEDDELDELSARPPSRNLEDFDGEDSCAIEDSVAASEWSEGDVESTADVPDKPLPRRPKTPEFIDEDEDIPELTLPDSSTDLFIDNQNLMLALQIYEVLRRYRSIVRLSPFRFEDFCAAVTAEDQCVLIVEIHANLLRSLIRADEANYTSYGPPDVKDSVNIALHTIDALTWFECIRAYLDADAPDSTAIAELESTACTRARLAMEKRNYSALSVSERLEVLASLTNLFLSTNGVREEIVKEGNIQYDDHCRSCHRLGDLLCCDTCSAVYHLQCLDTPLNEVPEEDWICDVCKLHQLKGVTDCTSDVEKSGLLCRQDPIGYDRHRRKYWFLVRRLVVEGEDDNDVYYYSTPVQLDELMEHLDAERYEKDLVSALNDIKQELIRQMNITEELTKKGCTGPGAPKTSVLDIANEALKKQQEECAAQKAAEIARKEEEEAKRRELEDAKKKEEEEETRKNQLEAARKLTDGETGESNHCTNHETAGGDAKNSVLKVSEATSTALSTKPLVLLAPLSSSSLTKSGQRTLTVISKDGTKMSMTLVSAGAAASGGSIAKRLTGGGDGSNAPTSILLPPSTTAVSTADGQIGIGTTSRIGTPVTTTAPGGTSRAAHLTRYKTGSLTPKQFADSITMTKTATITTASGSRLGQDGGSGRGSGLRSNASATSLKGQANNLYRLGSETVAYVNQYSVNPLALNRTQHTDERDKRRHLSHKFSITPASDFVWRGGVVGMTSISHTCSLTATLLALENGIHAPFLHPDWSAGGHRAQWIRSASRCATPEQFGSAMAMLEACIKPVTFNQVWHDALGHIRLKRTVTQTIEETKKKERDYSRKRKDDDELDLLTKSAAAGVVGTAGLGTAVAGGAAATFCWVKYSLGLRHQVYRQRGEEYRITGQGGWYWVSASRVSHALNARTLGLRLLAARLRARKRREEEKKRNSSKLEDSGTSKDPFCDNLAALEMHKNTEINMIDPDIAADEICNSSLLQMDVECIKPDVMSPHSPHSPFAEPLDDRPPFNAMEAARDEDEDVKQLIKEEDEMFDWEIAGEGSMKSSLNFDSFDISAALVNRTHYPRINTPYSRLDELLSRRLKAHAVEQQQKVFVKQLIDRYQAEVKLLETAAAVETMDTESTCKTKFRPIVETSDTDTGDSDNGEGDEALDHSVRQIGIDAASKLTSSNHVPSLPYKCYSVSCMSHLGEQQDSKFSSCYSPTCRSIKTRPSASIKNLTKDQKHSLCNGDSVVDGIPADTDDTTLCNGTKLTSVTVDTSDMIAQVAEFVKLGAPSGGADLVEASKRFQLFDSILTSGKILLTAEIVEVFKKNLEMLSNISNKYSLRYSGGNRTQSVSAQTGSEKKSKIPPYHRFLTNRSNGRSLFMLERAVQRALARLEGKRECLGFNYLCKMTNVSWPYPCPRPYFKTAWRYRTQTMHTLSAVAVQLRILWACIRWDDLSTKAPLGGMTTVTTDADITTTEVLERKDIGTFGLRSEYLVRRIIVPIGVPSTPKVEKPTPQRSGLRQRRRPESPKLKEPSVAETWVPEEKLELWQIKLFNDKQEKLRTQKRESLSQVQKIKETKERETGKELTKATNKDKSRDASREIAKESMSANDAEVRAAMEEQLRQQRGALAFKRLSQQLRGGSSMTGLEQMSKQSPSVLQSVLRPNTPSSPLTGASMIRPVLTGSPSSTMVQTGSATSVQNIRVIHGPNGQIQIQGLLPGQQLVKTQEGRFQLITANKPAQQITSTRLVQPVNARLAGPQPGAFIVSGNSVLRIPQPSLAATGSPSLRNIAATPAQIGSQRVLLTSLAGGQILATALPSSTPQQSMINIPLTVSQASLDGGAQTPFSLPQPSLQQPASQRIILPAGQGNAGGTVLRMPNGQHVLVPHGTILTTTGGGASTASVLAVSPSLQNVAVSSTAIASLNIPTPLQANNQPLSLAPFYATSLTSNSSTTTTASKYSVTPQFISQVITQALMQKQKDPDIQAKLLAMQQQYPQVEVEPEDEDDYEPPAVALFNSARGGGGTSTYVGGVGSLSSRNVNQYSKTAQKEDQTRLSVCAHLMKSMLDQIEKMEKIERKSLRKLETVEEKRRRINSHKLQVLAERQKENLKKDMLKKRYLLERSITAELQAEIAQTLEARRARQSASSNKQRLDVLAAAAAAAPAAVAVPPPPPPTVVTPTSSRKPRGETTASVVAAAISASTKCETPQGRKSKTKSGVREGGTRGGGEGGKRNEREGGRRSGGEGGRSAGEGGRRSGGEGGSRSGVVDEREVQHSAGGVEGEDDEDNRLYCVCKTPYDETKFYVGCDRCQDWYHGACVGVTKADADRMDSYVCPSCRRAVPGGTSATNKTPLADAHYADLKRLVTTLKIHKMAWPFLQPVSASDVPDYYFIIKDPMDLLTLQRRVDSRHYKHLDDFIKDVMKIFDNCRLYNAPATPFYKCADALELYFVEKLKSCKEKMSKT